MSTNANQDLKHTSLHLLKAYQHSSDVANRTELRNQLVEMNLGLVRKEVYCWSTQGTENYDDLLQVGCIGLIRAIERFDVSRGHAFSTFAMPYIRGEIQHYLRDKSPSLKLPRRWQDLQQQAMSVTRTLQQQLHRPPTDAELAAALAISVIEWQNIKLAFRNQSLLSLDAPVRDDNQGLACLGELLPDTRYRSFQLAQEDRVRLQQAFAHLENRTRQILEFVFLHDLTQKETAERLGISVITVSRRVKQGLEALKKLMMGTSDQSL